MCKTARNAVMHDIYSLCRDRFPSATIRRKSGA